MSDFRGRDVVINLTERRRVEPPADCAPQTSMGAKTSPSLVDCSAGDRPRVIISDTTAILLAEAFCDAANAYRLYVTGIEGAENFTRAFGELELLKKAIGDGMER